MLLSRVTMAIALSCLLPTAAFAQNYGDWSVGSDSGGVPFMVTTNDSDGIFGKWCDSDSETCFWIMSIQTRCNNGAEFPALINSPLGSVSVSLTCTGPKQIGQTTYHRLVIHEFDLMTRLAREGKGRIGIVIATEDGGFKVNRFSLSGGSAATARMERSEVEYIKTKQQKSTRDRVL